VKAAAANLTFTCNECKTPRFDKLVQQLYDIGESDDEVDTFIARAQNLADRFLSSDFLHHVFTVITAEAQLLCPSSTVYDPNASGKSLVKSHTKFFGFEKLRQDCRVKIFKIVSGVLFFTLVAIPFAVRIVLRAKRTKLRRAVPDDEAQLLQQHTASLGVQWAYSNHHTGPMYQDPTLPPRTRHGVPAMLALDMSLYLFAHFCHPFVRERCC
jgi:hypothetical protein